MTTAPTLPSRLEDVWVGYRQVITEVHLSLASNRITAIPADFFAKFQAGADPTKVPKGSPIGSNHTAPFTECSFRHNNIAAIPSTLTTPFLKVLDVSDNQLTLIEPGLMAQFPSSAFAGFFPILPIVQLDGDIELHVSCTH